MSQQRLYRCEWKKDYRGVYVETHVTSADSPDSRWVWHETEHKAKEAVASNMRWLADHLMREAELLTRDPRSK